MVDVKFDRQWCLPLQWRVAILWIVLALIGRSTQAELIVSVDFDPFTAGIQGTHSVQQGEGFTANFVLQYNDTVGLGSYWFSVQFDNSGLNYSSATSFSLANFSPSAGSPFLTAPNTIGPIEAGSVPHFAGPNSIAATTVASVTFNAGMSLGSFTISPFEHHLFDGSFRNDTSQINPVTFNSGSITITAVPEPSALALLTVVAALLSQRIRVRRKSAS